MRNQLCKAENCIETIELNRKFTQGAKEKIESLHEDEKKGIQRNPRDNISIIKSVHNRIFNYATENLRAKYSMGADISSLEEDFLQAVSVIDGMGEETMGYTNLLWLISVGVLLEVDRCHLEKLNQKAVQDQERDAVIHYLLSACGFGKPQITATYKKENPYAKTRKIIELARTDREAASKRLTQYMKKEWYKGHHDVGWRNAHKDSDYVGFWSFETAAIAKILQLDDAALEKNNHYPYELAHYKRGMTFRDVTFVDELIEEETGVPGIPAQPALEPMIPVTYHAWINELIVDYKQLDARAFFEKYNEALVLDEIWDSFEAYEEHHASKDRLGMLLVFALEAKEWILQLDYKEDIEDHVDFMKNAWKGQSTKLLEFELVDNDQAYFALVPVTAPVTNWFEVKVEQAVVVREEE
ncbi:hypothetical protein A374_15017 [Fictibacillus macauensis ZFHKF-1]|uniref:DUF1911 domain-containing protein n=1 Tax=Fictibacillus macauensis ZFHKF-1 TaxID=1196324 RepID=I8AFR5_9BACL|nr:PoNi-like cognate immunity protein [Fictibacillus macauensis]EIT84447.1 hypothetical protein A374_15017 [Fictibacillus macauensis ZFHKF-1]